MTRTAMTTTEIRDAAFEVAVELARQDKRLAEILSAIQLPPDLVHDVDLPSTVEIELHSRIWAVKTDYLAPSVELLMTGAQVTDSQLRDDFARWVKKDGVSFKDHHNHTSAEPGRKDTPC